MNHHTTACHNGTSGQGSSWVSRYSDKHKPRRIDCFPGGIEPPKKVRIYARGDHFLLQFWDPSHKKTLNQRVDGDLIEAIVRAREIDQRILHYRRSGRVGTYRHSELAARYLADLDKRCAAGEIDPATVARYESVIRRHYLVFCEGDIARKYPSIEKVDRDFQLEFARYLRTHPVSGNGHPNTTSKASMTESGQEFVNNVVRAMYQWAADPQGGNLLPGGFVNPFLGRRRSSTAVVPDAIQAPDITVEMAVDLIGNCDSFQLPIFSRLVLHGVRPSELGWLFRQDVDDQWTQYQCRPELDYYSKGRRNKKFPTVPGVPPALLGLPDPQRSGLVLLHCRAPVSGQRRLDDLVRAFDEKLEQCGDCGAQAKRKLRDKLMRAEGALNYDHIRREFKRLSGQLKWPARATLKGFRHLFATCLENAGVPGYFRKYLLGQRFAREPLATYTHITEDKLRDHYLRAIDTEMSSIVDAIVRRSGELQSGSSRA